MNLMSLNSPFFRGSILAELVSRTLFVGIVILFVYGGFAYYVSKKTFDHEMGDRLMVIARLSADQTKAEWLPFLTDKGDLYDKFSDFLILKKKESQAKNILILDPDGRVLVDANGQYDFRENDWLRDLDPEPFDQAKKGTPSVSILFPESDGGIYKVGYAPIFHNRKVIAVMGVESSAGFMQDLDQFAKVLFTFGLVCLVLMGGLLYAFARRFIKPIEELAKVSQKIAAGDFSQRVHSAANNELGAMTHAFNEMAKRLQSHNEYILESMSNGLLVVDLKGRVITFNKAASTILGLSQVEVMGRHYTDVFKSIPSFREAIRNPHELDRHLENQEVLLFEENPRIVRLRSAPLLGAEAQKLGTEIIFTDETQLRKLQNQIKVSEKMATIGELAAGIAHEIRNPLGAMKGFTEILQKKLKQNDQAKEMVADIAAEIEILNKIVTNFLVFAKPTSLDSQQTNLTEAIQGVLPLIENEAKQKKIRLFFDKKENVDLLLDVEQFRRAILNLALNAVQASPAKEEVHIEIHGFSRPELRVFLNQRGFSDLKPAETEGNWAVILVLDHGPGIQPENIKKLFTPFFTTKTEGFGLGLSITQKIVEALGGSIAAGNRPEGGAVFLVILPALDKKKEENS
jgi:two-component system sensor histidine kinase AtoS